MRTDLKNAAARIYAQTARRAREPYFYAQCGVADTVDGRFDLLALHLWLVLTRLAECRAPGLVQKVVDAAFSDLETALREQAAGDAATVKGLRRMAEALQGRLKAYDDTDLTEALLRNLYRIEPAAAGDDARAQARNMAEYAETVRQRLTAWMPQKAPLDFGPLPG